MARCLEQKLYSAALLNGSSRVIDIGFVSRLDVSSFLSTSAGIDVLVRMKVLKCGFVLCIFELGLVAYTPCKMCSYEHFKTRTLRSRTGQSEVDLVLPLDIYTFFIGLISS